MTRPPTIEDVRTPEQRRADALVELARLPLNDGTLPTVGGQRPHLAVLITPQGLIGDLPSTPASGGSEWVWPDEIPPERVSDDWVVADRVVEERPDTDDAFDDYLDDDTEPDPPAGPRLDAPALYARDRGCRRPGCDVPAQWCDAHHLDPWHLGGKTRIDRLVLLCRFHHMLVH